jgi:uncharacterized membrane protein YgcG
MRPMRVRMVIRRDLIHPRALQSVVKKKNQSTRPTMIAVSGFKKNEETHIVTIVIAAAIRVFMILFQSEIVSSFLSAKNTNTKLNTPSKAKTTKVQNIILSPVKFILYGASLLQKVDHASAVGVSTCGSSGGIGASGFSGCAGSSRGISPFSTLPSKNT